MTYRIDVTEDGFRIMDTEHGSDDCYAEFDTIGEAKRDTADQIKCSQERIADRLEENNEDLEWIERMESLLLVLDGCLTESV
jgi:hypothetical protein